MELNGETKWEDAILGHKLNCRLKKWQYLVLFKGYNCSEAMWMMEEWLDHAPELLA